MPENGSIYVIFSVDIDAPHELDEFSRLGPVMAARLVYRFANKVECYFDRPVLKVRLN